MGVVCEHKVSQAKNIIYFIVVFNTYVSAQSTKLLLGSGDIMLSNPFYITFRFYSVYDTGEQQIVQQYFVFSSNNTV